MANDVTLGAKVAIFYCQNKKFTEKISETSGLKTSLKSNKQVKIRKQK
jgi:hypothetical protein